MSKYDLTNRVVLITGAANGIGAACARRLYEAGMNLVLVDLAAESLRAVASDLRPERVLIAQGSVTDRARLGEMSPTFPTACSNATRISKVCSVTLSPKRDPVCNSSCG
jgi:NADP-dependent 3-hydroxy acid dehydrogenase YdfG